VFHAQPLRRCIVRLAVFTALVSLLSIGVAGVGPDEARAAESFQSWLAGVRKEARGRGVSEATLDAALVGVKPIPRVIELDRRQPEFTLKFDEYLDRVVTQTRIDKGRRLLQEHATLLAEASTRHGVPPRFIVALWGIETDFGRITGGFPVIAALATLAHDGRRSAFFRRELMLALEILDQGHIAPGAMQGSWAGAMGQSQFMPSSFHAFAIDHDGDGHKDIWTSLPDVFGSIANYLSGSGWRNDVTWGREVRLPEGFDTRVVESKTKKRLSEWQALGIRKVDGGDLPSRDLSAMIVMVTRKSGSPRYFLAYHNFDVILKWNRSTYFALAVGTLADALGTR